LQLFQLKEITAFLIFSTENNSSFWYALIIFFARTNPDTDCDSDIETDNFRSPIAISFSANENWHTDGSKKLSEHKRDPPITALA
jgi:hypothetical protein